MLAIHAVIGRAIIIIAVILQSLYARLQVVLHHYVGAG
ncbi:putative membrane protein [Candidatus Erwinia dacicola]|uniref:Membrane protein n=1 Tax=Candidatus Erwinia dacicola TaxID=252393 RepID=A0A328TLA4_9GAMM|nr:putative membrane protein [Candidatus Erwinia dacicola]